MSCKFCDNETDDPVCRACRKDAEAFLAKAKRRRKKEKPGSAS